MFVPENELGVIVVFSRICASYGLEIVSINSQYPDAVVRVLDTGEEIPAEFEFLSSSFITHMHDPVKCDLIVCWQNDYSDSLLPIFECSNPGDFVFKKASDQEKELMSLRIENSRLKRRNSMLRSKLNNPPSDLFSPPPGKGWRIEFTHKGRYFQWRRGSGDNRESAYGGKTEDLPADLRPVPTFASTEDQ